MVRIATSLLVLFLTIGGSHVLAQSPPAQALAPSPVAQPPGQLPPSQSGLQTRPSQTSRYSAAVLYNQANAYVRAGKRGLAVLNYERAALLAPNDPDIRANLEFVRNVSHLPSEPSSLLSRFALATSPAVAAWLGVLGVAIIGAALLAARARPRFRWMNVCAALVGIALIAMTLCNAAFLWRRMHDAVVLVDQTAARVSPVPMGETSFVLPEAETVTIAARHGDFVLIRTRAGLSGWVARAELGAVVP